MRKHIPSPLTDARCPIRWLQARYRFGEDCRQISVPETGLTRIREMADELMGTDGLVAIYITDAPAKAYDLVEKLGRVVGTVQLVPLPSGRSERDYQDRDPIDGYRAWPYGWPCRVVHAPAPQQCPLLSDLVKEVYGPGAPFLPFVAPLRYAPMRLDQKMSRALERYFN
jgi:hypothetical protein